MTTEICFMGDTTSRFLRKWMGHGLSTQAGCRLFWFAVLNFGVLQPQRMPFALHTYPPTPHRGSRGRGRRSCRSDTSGWQAHAEGPPASWGERRQAARTALLGLAPTPPQLAGFDQPLGGRGSRSAWVVPLPGVDGSLPKGGRFWTGVPQLSRHRSAQAPRQL